MATEQQHARGHEPHAQVKLDLAAMHRAAGLAEHETVEPIPWKTGRVGAVAAIDRVTGGPVLEDGYYHFRPHAPQGVLGESGERFLNNRQVFAYGRLNNVVIDPLHDEMVSVPASIAPSVTASRTAPGSSSSTGFELKPFGINSILD